MKSKKVHTQSFYTQQAISRANIEYYKVIKPSNYYFIIKIIILYIIVGIKRHRLVCRNLHLLHITWSRKRLKTISVWLALSILFFLPQLFYIVLFVDLPDMRSSWLSTTFFFCFSRLRNNNCRWGNKKRLNDWCTKLLRLSGLAIPQISYIDQLTNNKNLNRM